MGYQEWYEQLRMCDLVTDGKGSLVGASGEGERATRSACAIGIFKPTPVCAMCEDPEYSFYI